MVSAGAAMRGSPRWRLQRTTWWLPVAPIVALMAVYPWLDYLWGTVVYLGIDVVCAALVLIGVRRYRPVAAGPWWLIVAALCIYVVGDATWTFYDASGRVPFPSIADVFYLAFYPVLFVALAGFVRRRQNADRAAWLDALLWTLGAVVISWEALLEPYLAAGHDMASLIGLAYPVMDLVLLLMVLRMVADSASRSPAVLLLTVGMVTQLLADIAFLTDGASSGLSASAILLDLGWLTTYLCLAAAALHPSMVCLTQPTAEKPRLVSRWRLALLVVPALTAPAALGYQLFAGNLVGEADDAAMIALVTAVVIVLIVVRGSGLLAVAYRRTAEADLRGRELERALDERQRAAADLRYRVDHDPLTGLLSRPAFVRDLTVALRSLEHSAEPVSVVFLDLDDFKTVNDSLGHDAGDRLLTSVAERLQSIIAADGVVARFGGDEFAVLTRATDVSAVAARAHTAMTDPVLVDGRQLRTVGSIGLATATTPGEFTAPQMLQAADVAMYEAKRSGVASVEYRPGMAARTLQRLDMRERLMQALTAGELQPWFQPVVSLRDGRLMGFESLARWCREHEAPVPPSEWLPYAEETGLIADIDRMLFVAAVEEFQRWRSEVPLGEVQLAVNLSGWTLQQPDLVDHILSTLHRQGLHPSGLVLEITEGVLLDDPEVSERLQRLRATGIRIALDDFGTGWSSLDYLRRFPVDQLKLDKQFTAELGHSAVSARAIPAAVIHLAEALGLDVVAEGVETQAQADELVSLGFEAAQGFLFGRALPSPEVVPTRTGHRSPEAPLQPTALPKQAHTS